MQNNKQNMSGNTQVISSKEKFTDRNRAFCDEFLKNGGIASRAYLAVYTGITVHTAEVRGGDLLRKPSCASYLALARNEIAKNEQIERSFVVKHLRELITKCVNDNNHSNLLKALEQLSRIGGLYVEKPAVNVSTTGDLKIDFGGYHPPVGNITQPNDNVIDVDFTDAQEPTGGLDDED